jgi:aminoglycoside phosphotransferase (APT) family kinase protein
MTDAGGRFTEATMTVAMRQITSQLGVDDADARLLNLTNNAVFALPTAGLVIRILRSHSLHDRVHKVVRLARWFAEIGAPTVRLVTSIDQPRRLNSLLATVWHYEPPMPPTPTIEDLGPCLRRFHALGIPPFGLPDWDPVGEARARLADAEHLEHDDRAFIEAWCDRLAPRITDLNQRTDRRLMHGDAHAGNLLRVPDARVLLCDFDATNHGPWQFDLVPAAVGEVRFGRHGAHKKLANAYGYDVTTDPGWPLLRETRELKMITGALPYLGGPGIAKEFARRLQSIAIGDGSAPWTPFADLLTPPESSLASTRMSG